MNEKFFAALAFAIMTFTVFGSITVLAMILLLRLFRFSWFQNSVLQRISFRITDYTQIPVHLQPKTTQIPVRRIMV